MAYNSKKPKTEEAVPEVNKEQEKEIVKEIMTQEQQALAQEVKSSDADWQTITEDDLIDFSLGGDPYPLPKEAQVKQDKRELMFRWIESTDKRLKEVSRVEPPLKWWICNSVNTPFLKKYVDSNSGAIHCKDQMLVFKPYWMAVKVRELKEGISEAKLQAGSLKDRNEEDTTWRTGEEYKIGSRDTITAVFEPEEE